MRRQPSLRSQLNQIRMWVRQGRTDAWIAHKLDVGVDELARFKREHGLDGPDESTRARPADPLSVPPPEHRSDDLDEPEEEYEAEDADDGEADVAEERERPRRRSRRRPRRPVPADDDEEEQEEEAPAAGRRARAGDRDQPRTERAERGEDADRGDDADADGGAPRRRRRGRRGGRRHRGRRAAYEATFDHGDEGYGLWLDPSVADNPIYTEHWAGHRAVTVTVEAESITIRRAGANRAPGSEPPPDGDDRDSG